MKKSHQSQGVSEGVIKSESGAAASNGTHRTGEEGEGGGRSYRGVGGGSSTAIVEAPSFSAGTLALILCLVVECSRHQQRRLGVGL